jgi:hypothetical protein
VGTDQPEISVEPAPTPTAREQRETLIRSLQELRGSDAMLVYVTSTRGGVNAQMAPDAIRWIYELLPESKVDRLDLFLHSNGGDGTVPWRLMTLLRERANRVEVLIPYSAYSAATLACLGADTIVMHPMGVLGPIDPSIGDPYERDPLSGQPRSVAVEDVASYIALIKDDVGIRHEDELVQAFSKLADRVHPLTLGSAKRGTGQARMLGEKLLRLRDPSMEPHRIATLIEELTTKLYYHGHPISRAEAKEDLGLHVEYAPEPVERAMWDLYLAYERDLEMARQFDPIAEALAAQAAAAQAAGGGAAGAPAVVPGMGGQIQTLGPLRLAIVESADHAHVFEQEIRIATIPQPDGGVSANMIVTRAAWVREP